MVTRNPLVLISGAIAQLPSGDQINGTPPATSSTGYAIETASFSITTSQANYVFRCTGTSSYAATLPASPGTGFVVRVKNDDIGIVNVTPPSGVSIGAGAAAAVFPLYFRQDCSFVFDGTNWQNLWHNESPILGKFNFAATAVSSAIIALGSGFHQWDVALTDVVLSASQTIGFVLSFDGGATYKTGASDYSNFFTELLNSGAVNNALASAAYGGLFVSGSVVNGSFPPDLSGVLSGGTVGSNGPTFRGTYIMADSAYGRLGNIAAYMAAQSAAPTHIKVAPLSGGNLTGGLLSVRARG